MIRKFFGYKNVRQIFFEEINFFLLGGDLKKTSNYPKFLVEAELG
jgi:hypothetical protein